MTRQTFLLWLVFIMALGIVVQEHLYLSQPIIVVNPTWNQNGSLPESQTTATALLNADIPGDSLAPSGLSEVSPTGGQQPLTVGMPSSTDLWQPATIPPEQVNHILCVHGSPACGLGQAFYDAMVAHGIDPALALGFFGMESSYGQYGVAVATRGIGNIRCGVGHDYCIDGFRAFHTWEEGFRYWAEFMTNEYKTGAICRYTSSPCSGGLTTIEKIIPVYAPAGDNNDESAYITFVRSNADNWRAINRGAAGGS